MREEATEFDTKQSVIRNAALNPARPGNDTRYSVMGEDIVNPFDGSPNDKCNHSNVVRPHSIIIILDKV